MEFGDFTLNADFLSIIFIRVGEDLLNGGLFSSLGELKLNEDCKDNKEGEDSSPHGFMAHNDLLNKWRILMLFAFNVCRIPEIEKHLGSPRHGFIDKFFAFWI